MASALAIASARRGHRALLVEIDLEDRVGPLLGMEPRPGLQPVEILPRLHHMNVEGKAALEEYLGLTIPVKRVLKTIFSSKVYQYFVAAAPGLKELMTIGKIWYEVHEKRWDRVIVDCPATGHSLQYLQMPKAAYETFTKGFVEREARRVWDLLRDPESTAVTAVTLAEEMPVNETIQVCDQIRNELGLPPGGLIVNRFHNPSFDRSRLERGEAALREASDGSSLTREVISRAREEVEWAELNERHRKRLATDTGWELTILPYLFREEFGLKEVETLAALLEEASRTGEEKIPTTNGTGGSP